MLSDTKACASTCPTQLYYDDGSGSCGRCNAICGTCTGSALASCTSCADINSYWKADSTECVSQSWCNSLGNGFTAITGPPK